MKQSVDLIKYILFTLLLFVGGSAWGQVTFVGSGVIDEGHVSDYYNIVNNYTSPVSFSNDITSWEGDMPTNQGEHWNGSNDSYADRWSGGLLNQNDHYKRAYMWLPEGNYTIMTAGRGSSGSPGVTLSMKVDNYEVTMEGRGNQGLGITTDGVASFSTSDTYANNPNGRGWQYFYIKFDVGSSGANVEFRLSGSSTEEGKWMSFTTPTLLKAVVVNVNDATTIRPSNSGSIGMNATFSTETTTDGTYVIHGSQFPEKADCRFIRFYLVDAVTNNPVAIPNLTSSQGTTFHNYGTQGMATTSNTAFLDGNDFTLTLPNIRGQYKLFCYLSTSPGSQVVENGETIDVEPTITSAYEMDIAYPYPGSLRSGSIQTIEIPVNTSETSHNVTELYANYNVISTGLSSQGRALNEIQMHTWSDWGAEAIQTGNVNAEYVLNSPTGVPYGDPGVNNYVDLTDYAILVVTVTNGTPRFLFNRTETNGQCNQDESQSKLIEYPNYEWCNRYFTKNGNVYTVNLQKIKADKGFVHLHAIKGANNQNVTVESMQLYGTPLTDDMMHSWSGYGAGSSQTGAGSYSYVLGSSATQPFGDANVIDYADLSEYDKLVVTMASGTPRFLFNRTEEGGQCNADESLSKLIEYPNYDWCNRYFTKDGNTYIVDLEKMRNEKGFVHLHAIKGANWQSVNVDRLELYKNSYTTGNVYARLFVADKNTGEQLTDQNALTIIPSSGWTKRTNDPQNWVYYGSASGLKDALNNISVSSSNPLYQGNATVSLVISSNLTRLAPASPSNVNDIITEPNWEKQYLLDFYKTDDYIASLQTGGTEIRSAIELADADATSHLLTELPQINIPSTDGKVYARLFVADNAGETVDDQTLLSFGDLSSKGWTWREHYGWVYYGDGFSESQLQNITVSASTALAATGAMIGLVITTSDMSRLEPSGANSAAEITEEPNWEYLYLYHFTYPFAGTIKSSYFRHSKEVLLTSAEVSAGVTQIPLNEALSKIKSEYVKTNETLAQDLHIRWFVTYKGEMIANSEDYLAPVASGTEHKIKDGYGIYWNSATCPTYPLSAGSESTSSQTINWLNMNFTKPDYGHWSDYKVVIWMSDDTSSANGQTTDGSGTVLTHEPDINMVYYYSFFVEEDFRFVHSKGAAVEAYPDLQYLIKSSSVQQYEWDNTTSTQVPASGDIRQDVHTVIYDVYMTPNSGNHQLELPFQHYFGNGDPLEPTAYIRWYDWETDLGSDKLAIANPAQSWLESFTDFDTGNNRGLFAINRDLTAQSPTHDKVGVLYNTAGLSSTHVIACDVSKYYDGVYRGSNADTRPGFSGLKHPYMLHEPTLGLRYLLRIHPASEIASEINEGHNYFQSGLNSLNGGTAFDKVLKASMFNNMCEDNGRVAVSLNNNTGSFALRANLSSLNEYYVNNGYTQCNHITWRAYLEDERGLWRKSDGAVVSDSQDRIHVFSISNLSGTYTLLSNSSESKTVTATSGMRFHLVGCVGSDSYNEQAAVHYELEFIDAPALLVDELDTFGSDVLHRRKAYLDSHYIFGGRVYFDDYFPTTTLTNQNENHTEKPLKWADAQYGFCYPQIDQYRISTGGNSALTPIHGDYILLKSIEGQYSQSMDPNQPYMYYFWRPEGQGIWSEQLYDFTRDYGDGTYGSFLYVDASDEARTIASLEFDAKLCSGSQIFYTAAVADVTNGDANGGATPPQLMIRVYELNADGSKADKPLVSFLTGSLRSVAKRADGVSYEGDGYQYTKWYQTYGYTTIPSTAGLSGEMKTYKVDIDNYCENTAGADYCVDEIRFYTSTGKVTVNMSGGTCADENMTFSANMDVEHLENKMMLTGTSSNPQHIYYRIYEKTGQDASGAIQYRQYSDNSIYNNSGKSYGDVTICKYVLNNDGTLAENNSNNDGYEFIDGVLYFDLLKNEELSLEQGKEYFIALTADLNDPEPDNEETGWSNPNDACDVYSNFFIPRVKYVHFLTIDEAHDVVSQIIEGVCGQPSLAHKEYIIQTNYPDDDEPTGFKTLPYGTGRNLASVTGVSNPISDVAGEERDQNGVLFDFFVGTEAELTSNYTIGETTYNTSVLYALQHYRNFERVYPQFVSDYSVSLAPDYGGWFADNYAILQDAISKGKLLLAASGTFVYDLYETQTFLALPVKKNYVFDGVPYILCNYIPFTFTVNGGFNVPELALGFDDVDYTTVGRERIIRVGLEQLNKMKNKGYLLHVPVNMYLDKHRQSFKKLYFPQNSYLTISAVDRDANPLVPNTTDPQLLNNASNALGKKFAKIVPTILGDTRPAVDKTHMYLALDLSECEIDFHEGYQYEVATNFFDEDDEALNGNPDAKACIGDLFLMIKVVPEFVTWKSQKLATENGVDYYSANWYNDGNWQRSLRSELYKDANVNNAKQNTPTLGHPSGYDNNGEGSLNGLTAESNPGFVPMKFTYVTMPSGEPAPSLINEPRVTGVGVGDRRQGGGFLDLTQTTLLTDRSPRDPDDTPNEQRTNSRPTENIYYDLLVRYSYDSDDNDLNDPDTADPFGEGCFGHRQLRPTLLNSEDALTAEQATLYNDAMSPATPKVAGDILSSEEAHAYNWVDDEGSYNNEIKVFDCEKYQGNVCREIYFKPGAELLRQQRLTYQRAWVEIEMNANKWYLLASPLQCTYAGDMYVPTSMTNVADGNTVKGRQVTEAFRPINFDQSKGYSRTKYPIYQRSWGINNGNVYTKQNDIRANNYSANLNYSAVTTDFVEWGHTFNDVQVPYHTSENTLSQNLAGFSIRAHKKDQTDKTLIRLPKADTSYDYYDWTDTNSEPAASGKKTVSKPDFDYEIDDDTGNNTMVTLFTVPISNRLVTDEHQHDGDMDYSISAMQQNGDYVLVGNPYMVSIDMKKFFETNSSLSTDGYWTYEGSTATAFTVPSQTNTQLMKPMQAFFVKKGTATSITFNRQMQVDGNFPPPASGNGSRGTLFTVSAKNDSGSSSASVELNDKASAGYAGGEDVETLFDSNLADVPMVYTVSADGKAVSINQLPTFDVVPFGVTCNSDEPVNVIIDNSQFSIPNSQLSIYDALLGTTTIVNDGEAVSIQPNDYGRYFLTTTDILDNKAAGVTDGIVISVRNDIVTVTANSQIGQVRAISVSGATAYEQTDCGTSIQFRLKPGAYVIEAEAEPGRRTAKILVK